MRRPRSVSAIARWLRTEPRNIDNVNYQIDFVNFMRGLAYCTSPEVGLRRRSAPLSPAGSFSEIVAGFVPARAPRDRRPAARAEPARAPNTVSRTRVAR